VFGRLVRRGHDVTALVSSWPGAPARETVDGIDVYRTGSRYTFALAAPYHARRALPGRAFDIVVEDLNKVPLFSPLWLEGAPLVLLVHHLFGATAFREAPLPVAAATWLLERPLGRVYRGVPVQAVSHSTAEDLVRRGLREQDITVIHNGVDTDVFRPDPAGTRFAEPTLLYLGRLQRYKRVDLVLRAVALLAARGVAVRLLVAGKGSARAGLERLRDRLGLERQVSFLGFVDDAEKLRLLRNAWVHVFTSPREGWGISNLEAAACGTPTVASDAPGLRDSVVDGETGFLVPHGDVVALADRLETLLRRAELREDLGRGARRFALALGWDRAADEVEAHLQAVIAARASAARERRDRRVELP
jgi:glycosyltransferase involved in cell wall biosynthesis